MDGKSSSRARYRERYGLAKDQANRQFCATARARFEACADLEAKRAFLREHVERIVFDHGKVTIFGSIPLQGAVQGRRPFRIEGEIEKGSRRRWPQDERSGSWVPTIGIEAASHCKSL
jgi:hypothetical protein